MMDYEEFKAQVYKLTQIDLNSYRERQMKRRIDALIEKNKFSGYETYVRELHRNMALYEEFVDYLTINVSEFFRNPEQWKKLDEMIFPYLLDRFGKKLRIWSAACSTGDEPYSLVMALSKYVPLKDIQVIATDIDKQVLEKAHTGVYKRKSIAAVPEELVEKYFKKIGDNQYQIVDEVKSRVSFLQHNLLLDPYPQAIDMIVCRNVMIYFTDEAKDVIYQKFNDSLKRGGILFVGSTEQIINYKELNYSTVQSFFYKKNDIT